MDLELTENSSENISEYGEGFAYNLGLFLAHADRDVKVEALLNDYSMWFNAAGDHLFDLCIDPNILGEDIANRAEKLQSFVLKRRMIFEDDQIVKKEDRAWAIQEAKNLLLMWDKRNSVPCAKAGWE